MPKFSLYSAESAQEFLGYLETSRPHWHTAERGDLAYRGQASKDWPLIPKAFRTGQRLGYKKDAPLASPTSVVYQARAEFNVLKEFVQTADNSGLPITEAGGRLLVQGDPAQIFNASNWEFDWPQNEILETLALAQHYGVPTRLLDFTEDPFVAAYFAASEAWDSRNSKVFEDFEKQHLAVWVIDLRFVQCLDNIRGRYPDRIRIIRVPRANNSYLRAQFGFFLVDRGANDMMTRGELLRGEILPEELLSLDRVIADRSSSWQKVHHITCPNQLQTWFGEPPVRRITLHADHTGELLKELSKRGITKATVMPSLDRIVESLAFQMSI